MSGISNYPTTLDDDTSLHDVVDSTTPVVAAHHNNLKEAIKALEAAVGIYGSADPDSLEYRLGSATDSHSHNGASGQGRTIDASAILASVVSRAFFHVGQEYDWVGSAASQIFSPIAVPRTMQLEALDFVALAGPTAATTVVDIRVGPTSIWYASTGHKIKMGPTSGRMRGVSGTPNIVTVASGSIITVDFTRTTNQTAFVGGGLTLVFRE